jgi:tRNA pseudouridine55 synthase
VAKGFATMVASSSIDGVLNVSKPAGWTSHDVVGKVRRSLGVRKVGHAGTLDPMATGVLPILLGKATRASEYLMDWDKEYEAVLRLGQNTDTQDATGAVIQERSVVGITEEAIRAVVSTFSGDIQQVPPMYSALKVSGRPLYKLARAGKTVDRKPRPVTIHQLEVLSVDIPEVSIRVACSKGTYIRTLCVDIGEALGVGAHLRQLCRTRVGPIHVEDSVSPLDMDSEFLLQDNHKVLWSLDAVLSHLPEVMIDSSMVARALNGAPIPQSSVLGESARASSEVGLNEGIIRVKNSVGQLLGLGKFERSRTHLPGLDFSLVLVKVFEQID